MLKETEIKQTIGFVVILFIIGGVQILASTSYLFDYAYISGLSINFLFLFENDIMW